MHYLEEYVFILILRKKINRGQKNAKTDADY
jgi:hypothetical protein